MLDMMLQLPEPTVPPSAPQLAPPPPPVLEPPRPLAPAPQDTSQEKQEQDVSRKTETDSPSSPPQSLLSECIETAMTDTLTQGIQTPSPSDTELHMSTSYSPPLLSMQAEPATSNVPSPPALSLDNLLDLDNARQCLVFSPLDSLPRLDLDDLRLDVSALEQWLGLPASPGASIMQVPPLSASASRAAELAVAETLSSSDELGVRAEDEGWSLIEQLTTLGKGPANIQAWDSLALRLEGSLTQLEESQPVPYVPMSQDCTISRLRWSQDSLASMLTWTPERVSPLPMV